MAKLAHTYVWPGRLAIACALLLPAGRIYADDNWQFEPSLTQTMSWDSNPLMLTGSHESLFGSVTVPQLTIRDNTPTTKLNASLSVDENIFNQSDFDSTDFHSNINLDQKLEQWELGFIEQTDYDTTRTSELSTLNTLTTGSVRHFGNAISPEIAFNPTSVDKISVTGSYADSRYDSSLFVDYHIISITPAYQHAFDPLNTGTFSVLTQRYQTDASLNSTIDSVAPTVAWATNLTPSLTAKASVGAEDVHQQSFDISNPQWRWEAVYSGEIDYKNELDSATLSGMRNLQPYPNGTELFLNTISLADAHTLNALFSANLGASYQFAGSNNEPETNLKSMITANAGIAYHLTEKFDITAAYQYREQTLTNISGNQDDNLFTLSLSYHPVPDSRI